MSKITEEELAQLKEQEQKKVQFIQEVGALEARIETLENQ